VQHGADLHQRWAPRCAGYHQNELGVHLRPDPNAADYRGRLVSLTYYSLSYDQPSAAATEALNQPIIEATRAFHGILPSGFDAFKTAALAAGGSSCAAGLLIVLPTGGCDVHPTPRGRDLLAQAILSSLHRGGEQDEG
jgi:hypothetical protein